MAMTTIRVPQSTRYRLQRLADADGLTLAEEIEKLIDQRSSMPKPTMGHCQSGHPLSAEEIDAALAEGFGEWP